MIGLAISHCLLVVVVLLVGIGMIDQLRRIAELLNEVVMRLGDHKR